MPGVTVVEATLVHAFPLLSETFIVVAVAPTRKAKTRRLPVATFCVVKATVTLVPELSSVFPCTRVNTAAWAIGICIVEFTMSIVTKIVISILFIMV